MIGLFDSGLGGLTILRELNSRLPGHNFIYLGDNADAPYGDKTTPEITDRTRLGVEHLFRQGCRLVILACNTASAVSLRDLQQNFLPQKYPQHNILGIIVPTVEFVTGAAWRHTHPITTPISQETLTIGVLATPTTVRSQAYPREIHRRNQSLRVVQQPCPNLAALIEDDADPAVIEKEAVACLRRLEARIGANYHAILLGCTHYDLVHSLFRRHLSPSVKLYRQPPRVARSLSDYLIRHPEIDQASPKSETIFLTTGDPSRLAQPASRFFQQPIDFQPVVLY